MSENNHIEGLIIRYLQQDISEEDVQELDAWLGESSDNMSFFFQLKDIYDLMRNNKYVTDEELEKSWQQMYTKLTCKSVKSPPNKPKRKAILVHSLKYVAIIIIAIIIGRGFDKMRDKHSSLDVPITFNEIHIPKGGKPNILSLSDGSKVFLNAATTFKYPTSFSKGRREVYLNGEAFFEIKKDSLNPFVVKIKNQYITVLGTSFNVEGYTDDTYNIVTLVEGSVTLETFNEKGESISNVQMKPDQKAYYDRQTEIISIENVDASLVDVWTKGEYKFKDEPFFLIIKRLENYYGVTILLEDDSLKNIKYTGTFSLDQNIQEVLKIINHEKQFVFSQPDKDNIIHIRLSNKNK